jgi:iron(III) transport system substrate-binding protein
MKRLITLFCAAFALSSIAEAADTLNVYSARKEELIKPLLDQFTAETGIEVKLLTGKDDQLLERLQKEGRLTKADLLITVDAGRLYRAKEAGLLQSVESAELDQRIPQAFRDSDGQWYGLSLRGRTMFYNKNKVEAGELTSYADVLDSEWQGRVCIRSSSNIYNQSLVASMIANFGEKYALNWAEGIVSNMARDPAGGDTDQLRAAAAGVCDVAIANTYYFGRLIKSDAEEDQAVVNALVPVWPDQDQQGLHMNVSGIGVTSASKKAELATQLIEFLVNDESQTWYAEVNNEYPVVEGTEIPSHLAALGLFKADTLSMDMLGVYNRRAVELMNKAAWK